MHPSDNVGKTIRLIETTLTKKRIPYVLNKKKKKKKKEIKIILKWNLLLGQDQWSSLLVSVFRQDLLV